MTYAIIAAVGQQRQPASNIRQVVAAGTFASFDDLVQSFEPNVISYWKFANTGTDEEGQENATITGSPELSVSTIVELDTVQEGAPADGTVIAWSGTNGEYAQAAHDVAHKTAAGTIIITAQHDSFSDKSTLLAADANQVAGGISIEVNTDGSPRSFLRRASDGAAQVLTGQPGDIQLDRAYTHIFKWGSLGLVHSIYDDTNTLVRRMQLATVTDGLSGTSPIRFGAWHTDVSHHDGPYGRIIWLDRQLAHAEEAVLAKAKTIVHVGTPSGEYITTPELHGWTAGGSVQAKTDAFNLAINDARVNAATSSTGRGVVELVQGRTYTVKTTGNGTQNNQTAALSTSLANVEIRTIGKPLRASGNQATIQIESWAGKTGQHNQCIIRVENDDNFFLGWVIIHGNKQSLDNVTTSINYNVGQNSGIHNIVVYGGVTNFNMKEVSTEHAIADALLVDQGTTLSTGHLYEDCTFKRSRRQGLSFIKGGSSTGGIDQFIFRRCDFIDNGDYPGDVPGQQPGYGFDVEADETTDHVYGFSVYDSLVNNNKGSAYHHGSVISSQYGVGFVFHHKAICSNVRLINVTSTNNWNYNVEIGQRDAPPTWTDWRIENLISTGAGTSNKLWFGGTAGTNGGSITNLVIINANTNLIEWEAGAFVAPHKTSWGCTIWRGNFSPTVTTNGVTTITNNAGFP